MSLSLMSLAHYLGVVVSPPPLQLPGGGCLVSAPVAPLRVARLAAFARVLRASGWSVGAWSRGRLFCQPLGSRGWRG